MPRTNILVAAVDGLRASALGAYGNTTFPTSALDEFAADSMLFDSCFSLTDDLIGVYASLWRSIHPARLLRNSSFESHAAASDIVLPTLFADLAYRVSIVTDEPQLARLEGWNAAHERVFIDNNLSTVAPSRTTDTVETELARLFAACGDLIGSPAVPECFSADLRRPRLIWLHARGMYGTWDAPLDLQDSLRDENDPPVVERAESPGFVLAGDGDPDAVFRYVCAYAAQVMTLDACWGQLLERIASVTDDDPWLVMLIGARGFPLGEHGRIGGVDSRLFAEQLHVPWLIRFPDGRGRLSRESGLATHIDVLPTLLDWIGAECDDSNGRFDGLSVLGSHDDKSRPSRDALFSATHKGGYALRTADWCLHEATARPADPAAAFVTEAAELYVRPDDRWEANDVSKLCMRELDELRAVGRDMWRRYLANERDR